VESLCDQNALQRLESRARFNDQAVPPDRIALQFRLGDRPSGGAGRAANSRGRIAAGSATRGRVITETDLPSSKVSMSEQATPLGARATSLRNAARDFGGMRTMAALSSSPLSTPIWPSRLSDWYISKNLSFASSSLPSSRLLK
jgi:hypothetical protein